MVHICCLEDTSWLPNHMGVCLEMYHELIGAIKVEDLDTVDADEFKEIKSEIEKQTANLMMGQFF